VNFPVTVHSEDALHDTQFGHVRRPTHDSMEYDTARFEVCNHKWTALAEEGRGAAVLKGGRVPLDLRPFEIRTLRFRRD
jgi:alpha-mannosidase